MPEFLAFSGNVNLSAPIRSIYRRLHYFTKSIALCLERRANYVVLWTQTSSLANYFEVDHACITLATRRAAVPGRGSYAFPRRLTFYRADHLRAY
jgi:hypothetical protein